MRFVQSTGARNGKIGNLIFSGFGLFFAFFGALFVRQEWIALQEARAMQQWIQTPCTIVSSEIADDGEDFRLDLSYRYEVGGRVFTSTRYGRQPHYTAESIGEIDQAHKQLASGKTFDCHYNPANPAESVLNLPSMSSAISGFAFTFFFPGFGLLFASLPWLRRRKKKEGKDASKPRDSARFGKRVLIIFGGVFLLVGLFVLKPLLVTPLYKVENAKSWISVPATVVSSKVKSHTSDDSTTYSPYIAYRYEVGGEEYLGDQYSFMGGSSSGYERKAAIVRQYPKGGSFTLFVNPANPVESVIQRESSPELLVGLVPLLFICVGAGIMVAGFRAKKAKLDSAQAQEHVVELKGPPPFQGVLVSLFFVAVWSGFTFMIFKFEVSVFLRIVFGGVELAILGGVVYSCLALFNPRPKVEITPGNIHPGTSIALRWRLSGRVDRIGKLSISLQCLRITTESSGHGKNRTTRIVKTPIFENELLTTDRQNEIAQGTLQFCIPEEKSSSIPGNNGGIRWQLVFRGDIVRWPDLKQELPFIVYPT